MLDFKIEGNNPAERLAAFNPVSIAIAETVRSVREDAAKGKGYSGQDFAPYTRAYKKRRAKLGLKTDTVTLRVKAEDSLLDTLGEQEPGVITVAASKEGQAQGLAKKRDFIGVSDAAITRMEEDFVRDFERMFS